MNDTEYQEYLNKQWAGAANVHRPVISRHANIESCGLCESFQRVAREERALRVQAERRQSFRDFLAIVGFFALLFLIAGALEGWLT